MTTYCLNPNETWLAVYTLNTATMPTNNVVFSELIADLSANWTSAIIKAWEWSLFEVWMIATIEQLSSDGKTATKREVVSITWITDNVLTITRWYEKCVQDDTATPKTLWNTAQAFTTWARISVYVSKALLNWVQTRIEQVNNPHLIQTECCRVTVCNRLMNSCDCWKQCIEVLNQQCFTNWWFGSWCDGDCVMTWNVYLCANRVYQFENLTICPWAVVRFEWQWVPQIKVYNKFINNWTIDTRAWFVKNCCCSKNVVYAWLNTCAKGCWDNANIVPWTFWTWWKWVPSSRWCDTWTGREMWCPWCCASSSTCWWAWWKWWDNYAYCCGCWKPWYEWCPASWENWWAWWSWRWYDMLTWWDKLGGGGWWWWWAWRFWNGWAWWNWATWWWSTWAWAYGGGWWWNWWNSWLRWHGGNWWQWWYGWPTTMWWHWWNGWDWYTGWTWWNGWTSARQSWWNTACWWTGGNGWDWIVCWWRWWKPWYWCWWWQTGWNWWNAITNIYWLIMNVRCPSWNWKIVACWWYGWDGASACESGDWYIMWTGGNWWNGADWWQVVYIYQEWTPEQILVNGWAWWKWWCWKYYCSAYCTWYWTDWCDWTAWNDWWKCIYQITN